MTSAAELLKALADFLGEELAPDLQAAQGYKLRIAVNLLAVLEREQGYSTLLHGCDERFRAEWGETNGFDAGASHSRDSLSSALAIALRDDLLQNTDALQRYLRLRAMLTLLIDNPRYSALQQARERWPELAAECDALTGSVT